jgi:hypothetical protein
MSASMELTRMTSKCEIKILTGGRSDFEARKGRIAQSVLNKLTSLVVSFTHGR